MTDLAPGTITVADLYREITGMRTDMAGITTKLAVTDAWTAQADRDHADYEARLRVLERFRFTLLGASLSVGTAAGVISGLLTSAHR